MVKPNRLRPLMSVRAFPHARVSHSSHAGFVLRLEYRTSEDHIADSGLAAKLILPIDRRWEILL